MTERTAWDEWEEQSLDDFKEAELVISKRVAELDDLATSWHGITPAEALERLRVIRAACDFAIQAGDRAGTAQVDGR